MAEFLVELYAPRSDAATIRRDARRARRAARELTREGVPVRYLRAVFVPDDETCFYLYEAKSADAVQQAADRAALRIERVTEAVSDRRGSTR